MVVQQPLSDQQKGSIGVDKEAQCRSIVADGLDLEDPGRRDVENFNCARVRFQSSATLHSSKERNVGDKRSQENADGGGASDRHGSPDGKDYGKYDGRNGERNGCQIARERSATLGEGSQILLGGRAMMNRHHLNFRRYCGLAARGCSVAFTR